MSTLQQRLDRLGQRLEEQEVAAAIERAQRHCELHGLPFSAETRAGVEAFQRHKRGWPTDLDMEEQIRRTAAWWADRMGLPPEEVIAEAERLAERCREECPHE